MIEVTNIRLFVAGDIRGEIEQTEEDRNVKLIKSTSKTTKSKETLMRKVVKMCTIQNGNNCTLLCLEYGYIVSPNECDTKCISNTAKIFHSKYRNQSVTHVQWQWQRQRWHQTIWLDVMRDRWEIISNFCKASNLPHKLFLVLWLFLMNTGMIMANSERMMDGNDSAKMWKARGSKNFHQFFCQSHWIHHTSSHTHIHTLTHAHIQTHNSTNTFRTIMDRRLTCQRYTFQTSIKSKRKRYKMKTWFSVRDTHIKLAQLKRLPDKNEIVETMVLYNRVLKIKLYLFVLY